MQPSKDIGGLIAILAALRHPQTGCGWDLEQTHRSLAPYALEEAYEVVDAIERGEAADLREELGDLLLQVVFHARIAEEAGDFTFGDIVEAVTAKMLRRHPHVFPPAPKPALSGVDIVFEAMKARREGRSVKREPGDSRVHGLLAAMKAGADKASASNDMWEAIKAEERRAKGGDGGQTKLLGDVALALPGLARAVKLQQKASTVGFDWNDATLVLAKIREELAEIEGVLGSTADDAPSLIADEIGDLFFAVANLARHLKVDAEGAVRSANAKFERRFAYIEDALRHAGASTEAATLDEMDALWTQAKERGL